ncbi:copper chaperone CopZ [Nakamurella sp. UYEF19]|uniref:heavy-metal-associated domain-containing protein n=1 Tax=Nakamurella sp. UYEF19 TaxID=1756392 RepID=UPI0033960D2A
MSEIHHLDLASTKAQEGGCGCGCGTHDQTTTSKPAFGSGTEYYTTTFQVEGMTCGHCVGAVTSELTDSVPGVQNVQIDLATGDVVVTSTAAFTETAAAAAVEEAGYHFTPGSLR